MKVFFTAPYSGSEVFGEYYKAIYNYVESLGYHQVDNEAVMINYEEYVKKMSESREAQSTHFKKKIDSIQSADICVVEVSTHSLGTGFVIQRALAIGKPTIALYYKDNTPFFINGIQDEKLIVKSYDDNNYKKVIREALNLAREKRDKRFNFFLSPKLLNYVEDTSRDMGVTKSKLLRDMIVSHMRENKIEDIDEF